MPAARLSAPNATERPTRDYACRRHIRKSSGQGFDSPHLHHLKPGFSLSLRAFLSNEYWACGLFGFRKARLRCGARALGGGCAPPERIGNIPKCVPLCSTQSRKKPSANFVAENSENSNRSGRRITLARKCVV